MALLSNTRPIQNVILGSIILVSLLGSAPSLPDHYNAPETAYNAISEDFMSKTDIMALIIETADKYGVSAHEMAATISCESDFIVTAANPTDSDGGSWGIAQINIGSDAHPHITKEQAFDPYFAIDFMASEFAKGNQWKWTCWKSQFGG